MMKLKDKLLYTLAVILMIVPAQASLFYLMSDMGILIKLWSIFGLVLIAILEIRLLNVLWEDREM